jgi:hypothetical protein
MERKCAMKKTRTLAQLRPNVPVPMTLKTTEFVTNNNMVIIPHPRYSPDIATCDFTLFPKLKIKNERMMF